MSKFKCNKCNSSKYTIENKGSNVGLYCGSCGKWSKWLSKDEVRVYTQPQKEKDYRHEMKYLI